MCIELDKKQIEHLHNAGLMPDRYYYQLHGKTENENYKMIKRKKQIDKELELYKSRRKAEIDKQIEEELTPQIEKALDELLKDWE